MTSIQSPAKIDAHLLRAPAVMFKDVAVTDPPTGVPWKSPEARFATPCPMKSELVDEGLPSGFGADSATPAPCTTTIAAMASAPITSPTLRSESRGSTRGGMPVGIWPTSSTVSI